MLICIEYAVYRLERLHLFSASELRKLYSVIFPEIFSMGRRPGIVVKSEYHAAWAAVLALAVAGSRSSGIVSDLTLLPTQSDFK